MNENQFILLLHELIRSIRINDNTKYKLLVSKLINAEVEMTPKIKKQILSLGSVFSYYDPTYILEIINRKIKQKENYVLRIIRQDIMYSSDNFNIKEWVSINKADLSQYPDSAEFLNFKGLICREKGEFEKALYYMDISIEKEPDNINYIRNKALVLLDKGNYIQSQVLIQKALGIEPDDPTLLADTEYIDVKQAIDEHESRIKTNEDEIKKTANSIKGIRLDYIAIMGLFVTILTVVIRIVTFDYVNYTNLPFWEIVRVQLAINFPWIIALIFTVIIVIFAMFMKK